MREEPVIDLLQYSVYPSSSLLSIFSSPIILPIRRTVTAKPTNTPNTEPSSNGAPISIRIAPRYIRCLTKRYTSVETTVYYFAPGSGPTVTGTYFPRMTRRRDSTIRPARSGKTEDHPYRLASNGISIIKEVNQTTVQRRRTCPAFLVTRAGLLVSFLQKHRVLPIKVIDRGIAEQYEPDAERPPLRPGQVPGE